MYGTSKYYSLDQLDTTRNIPSRNRVEHVNTPLNTPKHRTAHGTPPAKVNTPQPEN